MTEFEARVVLGLHEDDPITKSGLKMSEDWLEDRLTRCPKYEKSKLRRELEAVRKLLYLLNEYG